MMTTNLFVIANVKQLWTGGNFRILLPFFRTSWGVGVLNSAIFNSFHSRVEFGTILEGLRNFAGGRRFEPSNSRPLGTPLACAILSFLACPVLQYISTLSHKLNIKSVFRLSVQLLSGIFPIPNRTERDIIINVHRSSCRVFLTDFNETWIFATEVRKSLKYEISWKSVQWEQSCSRRTNRQTDMKNLIVAFRNFSKAHTNHCCMLCQKLNRNFFDPW